VKVKVGAALKAMALTPAKRLRRWFRTHGDVAITVELRDGAQPLLAHLLHASCRFALLLTPPLTFGRQ
jgi:ribosome-associated translation inhibitor RaiA